MNGRPMKTISAVSASPLCRNWLEGLTESARAIGEWEDDELFWPRLASLAFSGVLVLRIRVPDSVEGDWLPPADAADGYAGEHIRESVTASLRTEASFAKALRLGFAQGIGSLPRAFTPRETLNDIHARGRWLVHLAVRLGFDGRLLVPDLQERLAKCHRELIPSNLFLISRLVSWRVCEVPDASVFGPVPEFVSWSFRHSGAEARIMPLLVMSFKELGTQRQPVWNPNRWILAGWKAAAVLAARKGCSELVQTAPVEDIRLKHELYRDLSGTLSPRPTFPEVAQGAAKYLAECRYNRSGPGLNAHLCVQAFNYAFWMSLIHHRFIPAAPDPTTET